MYHVFDRECGPAWNTLVRRPGAHVTLFGRESAIPWSLDQHAMASNDGEPVTQHFKLVLQDVSGEDITCDATVAGPVQPAWYDAE